MMIVLPMTAIVFMTRKHRQSYRHADPRRQQQHTAVVARHQQPCGRDVFRNRVTLTFDLLTSGSMHAERLL